MKNKNATCSKLAKNPDLIKRKYIQNQDPDSEVVWEADIFKICQAMDAYEGTEEELLSEIHRSKPDLVAFMKFIRGEIERPKARGFGKPETALCFFRDLGKALCGNEEAFLRNAGVPSVEFAVFDDGLRDKRYKKNLVGSVSDDLTVICSMLAHRGYANRSGSETLELQYALLLEKIRDGIRRYCDSEKLRRELYRLLDETNFMLFSCDFPNVCDRWLDYNPELKFYDCVFQIHRECPVEYKRIASGIYGLRLRFRFVPSEEDFEREIEYLHRCAKDSLDTGKTEQDYYSDAVIGALDAIFREITGSVKAAK